MTTYEPEADVERAWKAWDDMAAEIATLRARLEEALTLLREEAERRAERHAVRCPVCDGSGRLMNHPTWGGSTNPLAVNCHACEGAGWFWSDADPLAALAQTKEETK